MSEKSEFQQIKRKYQKKVTKMGTNSWGNDLWVSKINQTINWGIFECAKVQFMTRPLLAKHKLLIAGERVQSAHYRHKASDSSMHQIKIKFAKFSMEFKKKKNYISNLSMDCCAKRNPLVSRARKRK